MEQTFDLYYDNKLLADLRQLDKLRRRILVNYGVIGTVVFAGFIFEAITWMLLGVVFIIIFIFFYIRTFGVSVSYFQQEFYRVVHGKTSAFLWQSASFDRDRYLKLSMLQKAMLISATPDQYHGRNITEHAVGDDVISISEIMASSVVKNEKGISERINHFNGLVGLRSMQWNMPQPVILMHEDLLEMTPLQAEHANQENSNLLSWYRDKDIYERFFSPKNLLHILNYAEHSGNKIFISVFDDGVCVAVAPSKPFITPNLWHKVENKAEIVRIYEAKKFIAEWLQSINP